MKNIDNDKYRIKILDLFNDRNNIKFNYIIQYKTNFNTNKVYLIIIIY